MSESRPGWGERMPPIDELARRAWSGWFARVDPVRLDVFRRLFALTFLVYTATWFLHWDEWLTTWGFHYTAESKHWYHPDPWPPLPPQAVPLFALFLFGSTLGLMLLPAGIEARIAAWAVVPCALYVQLVDADSAFTLNKFYIVFFTVIALAPSPEEVELDGERRRLQAAWPIRVIQLTLIVQYFTAGTCKVMHGDWLAAPDVLWTQVQGLYRTDAAAWALRTLPVGAWTLFAHAALAFELLAPVLFGVRRLRPLGIAWGTAFHVLIALFMHKLFFFSFQEITIYVLFVEAETLRRVADGIRHRATRPT